MASQILIIDDDPDIRAALADVLTGEGYSVATATDGIDALRVLDGATRPALILLDQMMPRMDGTTFLRRLRADGVNIPVVVLTAAKGFVSSHDVPVLDKPIDLDELLEHVREHCGPPRPA